MRDRFTGASGSAACVVQCSIGVERGTKDLHPVGRKQFSAFSDVAGFVSLAVSTMKVSNGPAGLMTHRSVPGLSLTWAQT
jgi:hypothetical protein